MTFGELLSAGLVLQSFGIVGLLVQDEKAPAEPASAASDSRDEYRRRHGVVPIASAHEGFGIDQVPAGVYGFTYAPLAASPLFARQSYLSFEMHKAADGREYLLAYLTPSDAEAVRTGNATLDVRLYPEPCQDATELICLPASRLQRKTNNPSHEQGGWIPFLIAPQR